MKIISYYQGLQNNMDRTLHKCALSSYNQVILTVGWVIPTDSVWEVGAFLCSLSGENTFLQLSLITVTFLEYQQMSQFPRTSIFPLSSFSLPRPSWRIPWVEKRSPWKEFLAVFCGKSFQMSLDKAGRWIWPSPFRRVDRPSAV